MNQDINSVKNQKAEISSKIKELEEIPKAKLSSVWMTLVYILAIASVGIFVFKPVYYIVALALLICTVFLGVMNLLIVKSKNKKVQNELSCLRAEESKLALIIATQRTRTQTKE